MLRSIFSLIHKILDNGDKTYNNTKSRAVIYCTSNPDNTVNMDLEIDGQCRQKLKAVHNVEKPKIEEKPTEKQNCFQIKTDQGDTVTCTHNLDVKIVPTTSKSSRECVEERAPDTPGRILSFSNTDQSEGDGLTSSGDEEIGTNVHELLEKFPRNRVELSRTERDQISALMEQINKMKTGLERLQQIATQFNCSENFKQDVNFLVNQLRPALQKAHDESKDQVSSKM